MISIHEQYEQAVIASMAHMSDAEIQCKIDRLTADRAVLLYGIKVSAYDFQKSGDALWAYHNEMERRSNARNDAALAQMALERSEGRVGDVPIYLPQAAE